MRQGPILLCAATAVEVTACQNGIQCRTNQKQSKQSHFEILKTGMGSENAFRALEKRLNVPTHLKPSWIISTGFGGSRTPEIPWGTWVIGKSIQTLDHSQAQCTELDQKILTEVLSQTSLPWKVASFASLAQVLGDEGVDPKTKPLVQFQSDIGIETPHFEMVDMESEALMRVCKVHKIPYSILRLVSDTPTQPIPKSIIQFAQISLERHSLGKLRSLILGSKEVLTHPHELSQFLLRSRHLPEQLTEGLKQISSQIIRSSRSSEGFKISPQIS